MIKGFIFAQKVDEGFPGGHTVGGKVIVAFHSVVFVQADSLDDALQYLINNTDKLKCMQGAYTGLKMLAEYAESFQQLKKNIDRSCVDGDSEAKVIYASVSLPELPVYSSNCFLRFRYSEKDLQFVGVGDLKTDTAVYENCFALEQHNMFYRADLQLHEQVIFNATI